MLHPRIWFVAAAVLLRVATAYAEPPGQQVVAQVLGQDIRAAQIAGGTDLDARARSLAGVIYEQVGRDYVRRNGLEPTAQEIDELVSYRRRLAQQDRTQRARKLVELEQRLESGPLSESDRVRTEDFLGALRRLARYDADGDGEPPNEQSLRAEAAAQIGLWKLNKALFETYGGAVGVTPFGLHPYGALAVLFESYARAGRIEIFEPQLRERLWQVVGKAPTFTIAPDNVDFTPPWKYPPPSGYFDQRP